MRMEFAYKLFLILFSVQIATILMPIRNVSLLILIVIHITITLEIVSHVLQAPISQIGSASIISHKLQILIVSV